MENLNKAIEMLKQNKTGVLSSPYENVRYAVSVNAIQLQTFNGRELENQVLVAKVNNQLIGNSSDISRIAKPRGRSRWSSGVLSEQLHLGTIVPMIPFEVMRQAELSLKTFKQLDHGGEETIKRAKVSYRTNDSKLKMLEGNTKITLTKIDKGEEYVNGEDFTVHYLEDEHFTGARLFSVGTSVFLLDLDRNELPHGIINPFLVKLTDTNVTTISEAYESLKPQAVRDALNNGLEVKRQGEWFFIPVTNELESKQVDRSRKQIVDDAEKLGELNVWTLRGELRAGPNRPNRVEELVTLKDINYVSGEVSHAGREHKTITLEGWHIAIPNTATTSWTITGDID